MEISATMDNDNETTEAKKRRRSDLIQRSGLECRGLGTVQQQEASPAPLPSRSTLSSTSTHVKRFREYLKAEQQPTNFEDQDNAWLNEWLGNFYAEVVSYHGKQYSQKTLSCMRASLHRYLESCGRANKHDLKCSPDFRDADLVLVGRRRELQHQEATETLSNKNVHAPITEQDMALLRVYFRRRMTSPLVLMEAAAFYLLYYFSGYGCDLLRKLRADSVLFSADEHGRRFVTLRVQQEQRNSANSAYRCYEDPNVNTEDCPYHIIRDYVSALPERAPRLFMHAMSSFGFSEDYPRKRIGFKPGFGCSGRYLSELLSRLSAKLNLSRRYTNHCIRATILHISRSNAANCQTGAMIEVALRNYGRTPTKHRTDSSGTCCQEDDMYEAFDEPDSSSSSSCSQSATSCNVERQRQPFAIDFASSEKPKVNEQNRAAGSSAAFIIIERPSLIFNVNFNVAVNKSSR